MLLSPYLAALFGHYWAQDNVFTELWRGVKVYSNNTAYFSGFFVVAFYVFIVSFVSSQSAFPLGEIFYSNFIEHQPIHTCVLDTDDSSIIYLAQTLNISCHSCISPQHSLPPVHPPYPATGFLGKYSSDSVTLLSETFPSHPWLTALLPKG